jgi:hypothetical protein
MMEQTASIVAYIDRLTAFGLLAVSLMLLFYALERRSASFVLAFAGACVMGSIYGFLQGAWPFGLIEAVWSVVALRRWWALPGKTPARRHLPNVANFIADLKTLAPSAGRGSYVFPNADGQSRGFVQFIIESDRKLVIHRIWTPEPGKGNGAAMLRALCDLADRHGVQLALKVIPIGRKPFPMSREQLKQWYERFGFTGPRWKMSRPPITPAKASASGSPAETSPAPSMPG